MASSSKRKHREGISIAELLGILFVGLSAFVLANMLIAGDDAHLVHYFAAGVGGVAGYWIGFGWDRVRGPI